MNNVAQDQETDDQVLVMFVSHTQFAKNLFPLTPAGVLPSVLYFSGTGFEISTIETTVSTPKQWR